MIDYMISTRAFTTGLPPELQVASLKAISYHKDASVDSSIHAAKAFREELGQAHDTYHLSNTTVQPLVKQYRTALKEANGYSQDLLNHNRDEEPHPNDQTYLAEKLERSVESAKNLRQTIFPGPPVTIRDEPKSAHVPLRRETPALTDKSPIELHVNSVGAEKEKDIYDHLNGNIKEEVSLLEDRNGLPIENEGNSNSLKYRYSDSILDRMRNKLVSERQAFLGTLHSQLWHHRNLVKQNPDLLKQILEKATDDENALASGETTPRARPTTPNLLGDAG